MHPRIPSVHRIARVVLLVLSVSVPASPALGCRFWALIGTGYPRELVRDHLESGTIANLEGLGSMNRDGWGFAIYLSDSTRVPLRGPIVRRGGPPASHPADPEYRETVREIEAIRPRATIGHVRAGTSGHWGIPNPHPFVHQGTAFAHNGTARVDKLLELLEGPDGESYLVNHPTDYVADYIDSELYYMVLLKFMGSDPKRSVVESIRLAVNEVVRAGGQSRLNFVMSAGDTLYAVRYAPYDTYDPVRYYPEPDMSDPGGAVAWPTYWVVSSQVLGSDDAHWGRIPERSVGVFIPGEPPRFHSIAPRGGGHDNEPPRAHIRGVKPNPARSLATIAVEVPAGGAMVRGSVYDVQGRLVRSFPLHRLEAGARELAWDCCDEAGHPVPAGVYVCRLEVDGAATEERFTVVR